jgi:hypothetical protein
MKITMKGHQKVDFKKRVKTRLFIIFSKVLVSLFSAAFSIATNSLGFLGVFVLFPMYAEVKSSIYSASLRGMINENTDEKRDSIYCVM